MSVCLYICASLWDFIFWQAPMGERGIWVRGERGGGHNLCRWEPLWISEAQRLTDFLFAFRVWLKHKKQEKHEFLSFSFSAANRSWISHWAWHLHLRDVMLWKMCSPQLHCDPPSVQTHNNFNVYLWRAIILTEKQQHHLKQGANKWVQLMTKQSCTHRLILSTTPNFNSQWVSKFPSVVFHKLRPWMYFSGVIWNIVTTDFMPREETFSFSSVFLQGGTC